MHFIEALRNEAQKIKADWENSKLFAQMGDRGAFREAIIEDFLRPFLPECYGLSDGEVFSGDGAQSAQIDVVVYDAVFSAVLFRNRKKRLFPAESVFGAIEVKSDLNSTELGLACENVRRLKVLARPPSDVLDFTPLARLNVGDEFSTGETDRRNAYAAFVFGFRGPKGETTAMSLNRRLAENPTEKGYLPDFVFVSDPGYLVLRIKGDLEDSWQIAWPEQEFTKYVFVEVADDALPLFFLTLNLCLGRIRLRSLDYSQLWLGVLNQYIGSKA